MMENDQFPQMPEGHFADLIPGIFYYAKWFLSQYQAFFMLGTAFVLALTLLMMIINLFIRSKDDDDDDDDFGFDYR